MLVKFSYSASRRILPVDRGGQKTAHPKNGPPHKPRKRRRPSPQATPIEERHTRAASGEGCRLSVVELPRRTAPAVVKSALAELFEPSVA